MPSWFVCATSLQNHICSLTLTCPTAKRLLLTSIASSCTFLAGTPLTDVSLFHLLRCVWHFRFTHNVASANIPFKLTTQSYLLKIYVHIYNLITLTKENKLLQELQASEYSRLCAYHACRPRRARRPRVAPRTATCVHAPIALVPSS